MRKTLVALAAVAGLAITATPANAAYTTGHVKNATTSATSVKAYTGTTSVKRSGTGLCSGSYRYVGKGTTTASSYDAGCVKMANGVIKVTGIVKVYGPTGALKYTFNVGCSTNHVEVAVLNGETATVSYARLCAA